ncbi:MAG: AIR synthase related protein, partial [Thermoanaerobaculia bacterium]|nr:AIR synthase related protein [Thermoanaerobaculia bacterium]
MSPSRRSRRPQAPEGEDALLRWLARQEGTDGLIGDDAAILPGIGRVVTVDSQIAGTHFPADLDPGVVARRLLAVNLSDVAAMGAQPTHAFLAVSAPPDFPHRRFLRAFLARARVHHVVLAGGDVASS